jgi:hypothetical protein
MFDLTGIFHRVNFTRGEIYRPPPDFVGTRFLRRCVVVYAKPRFGYDDNFRVRGKSLCFKNRGATPSKMLAESIRYERLVGDQSGTGVVSSRIFCSEVRASFPLALRKQKHVTFGRPIDELHVIAMQFFCGLDGQHPPEG